MVRSLDECARAPSRSRGTVSERGRLQRRPGLIASAVTSSSRLAHAHATDTYTALATEG